MRGEQSIIEFKVKTGQSPSAIFVIEDKDLCDSFSSLQASTSWFPEIVLKKGEPVASMDFSVVDGQIVHAVLGENYGRSFRICEAIAQANPLHLVANITGGHPLLEWNMVKGFFENE